MPTTNDGVRHGENLLAAVSWFRDQRISQSSVEIMVERVEEIGLALVGSNVHRLPARVEADAEPRRSVR